MEKEVGNPLDMEKVKPRLREILMQRFLSPVPPAGS
jgi:hypothetical protein